MAVTTTSQTIIDGPRNSVMVFTGVCDGTGDQPPTVMVDVHAMNPPAGPSLKVRRYSYSVNGGTLQLSWDATVPQPFLELTQSDAVSDIKFGGLNTLGIPGATGNIIFSTLGFQLNSTYSITLEMIKGV